jgi:hypothetical protein
MLILRAGALVDRARRFATTITMTVASVKCEGRVSGRHSVAYLRVLLSAVAALILAILGPPLFFDLQHSVKTTGLAVFTAFSPLCAILAIVFFTLFFAAGRLKSKPLRLLLFWTPVTVISTLGLGLSALFAYAWLHAPKV